MHAFDLRHCVLAVCDADDHAVGTGFVAGPRLAVSCAHVIQAAGSGPGRQIRVRFEAGGEYRTVLVLAAGWRPPYAEDVAVLQWEGDLPPDVVPAPLGASENSAGHAFSVFGYPPLGRIDGIWANGRIEGRVREAGRALLQLTSPNLAQGISGGPVLDGAFVVGMVNSVVVPDETSKHHDTGFATPAETLWHVWPELVPAPGKPANPFYASGAVPPDDFVGRRAALELIQSRLGGEVLQSVSIVGERRIGKSSVLRYVHERASELFDPRPIVIYLDLMSGYSRTRRGFMKALHRYLTLALGREPWSALEHDDAATLSFALEDLSQEGVRIILCLDEVEQLTSRRQEFDAVLEDLRAAGQLGRIGLLTASARPLADLARADGLVSPFHNIFMQVTLGLLSRDEWLPLIQERMSVTPAELAIIERLAGGHPFYTQLAAARLWEARHAGEATGWDQLALEDLMTSWADQWRRLAPADKAALRATAGRAGARPAANVVQALTRRGLLLNGEPFSAAYADWLHSLDAEAPA